MTYTQTNEILRATNMDILCGRGKAFANHPGNLKFTQKIQSNLQKYRDAPKRIDRSIILATMVDGFFEEGYRFLKKDRTTNGWIQLNADQCHEKVGHALRDLQRKTAGKQFQSQSATAIAANKRQQQSQHEQLMREPLLNLILSTTPLKPPAPINLPTENVSDRFEAIDATPLNRLLRYVLDEEEGEINRGFSNLLTEMPPVVSVSNCNEINPTAFPDSTIFPFHGNFVSDSFRSSGYFESLDNRHDLTHEDLRDFEF